MCSISEKEKNNKLMEPLKWNPENKWKTEFGTDKTVKLN